MTDLTPSQRQAVEAVKRQASRLERMTRPQMQAHFVGAGGGHWHPRAVKIAMDELWASPLFRSEHAPEPSQ